MAKKKRKRRGKHKQILAARRAAKDPILRVKNAFQNARQAFRQRDMGLSLEYAERAFNYAQSGGRQDYLAAARRLWAEAHFRAGVTAVDFEEGLQHLDFALGLIPDEPRFHFHKGVLLWRTGRRTKAAVALKKVADRMADRPGVAFLRSLTQIAADRPWDTEGLSTEEANTLRLIEALTKRETPACLKSLAGQPLTAPESVWQALVAMQSSATAAPVELLETAAATIKRGAARSILDYYLGVAALRQGEWEPAAEAWLRAKKAGFSRAWSDENLLYLWRERAIGLAQEGRWQAIVDLAHRIPSPITDRILAETIGTAYYHLGYAAAQAGRWTAAVKDLRAAEGYISSRHLAQNLALCEEALENWSEAAEAWREMVRRRPRKSTHPDYLSDAQVAAIWEHAADCYAKTEWMNDEVITCLRTAVKYAENDLELRLKLADTLWEEDRGEAAENELNRILEVDENYIPALIRLASIYSNRWDRDPAPLLRRVLAIDPHNHEAREALAQYYLEQVGTTEKSGWFGALFRRTDKQKIELIKQGLQDVPGHPQLLLQLAILYRKINKKREARQHLLEAYRAAPQKVSVVGVVLHELLHLKDHAAVEEILPEVRQIPGLLMGFWVSQGDQVLKCKLGEEWAMRFFDEAITLAAERRGEDTPALALLRIFDAVKSAQKEHLVEHYMERMRAEVPHSGVLEYAEARNAFFDGRDVKKARRLARKAQRMARRAHEPGVEEQAKEAALLFSGDFNRFLDVLGLDWRDMDALDFL